MDLIRLIFGASILEALVRVLYFLLGTLIVFAIMGMKIPTVRRDVSA